MWVSRKRTSISESFFIFSHGISVVCVHHNTQWQICLSIKSDHDSVSPDSDYLQVFLVWINCIASQTLSKCIYSYRKILAYMIYISQFESKKNWQIHLSTLEESNQLSIIDTVFLLWKNRCSQVIISIALWTELPRIKATPVLRSLQSWIDLWLIRTSVIVERSDVVGLGHNYLKLSLVSLIGIHRSPLCVACHPCDYQVE